MGKADRVLCFGEIVWDALPEGIFLGGAPLNVAYHLNCLGVEARPVSAVGEDFLGQEVYRRLEVNKIPSDFVVTYPEHETGVVIVSLNEAGDAAYEIRKPAAWDFIEWNRSLESAVSDASGFVYGSLVTRDATSRNTLRQCLQSVSGLKLCDVNLRKPYDDAGRVIEFASMADWIKLNEDEVFQLTGQNNEIALPDALEKLATLTGVPKLCCTRGGEGAAVWIENEFMEIESPKVEVADTVGAGDAFTAAFLQGILRDNEPREALEKAVKLGGFVASRRGAQPAYDPQTFL